MWIFADFGLLMPARFPADKVAAEYMDEARTFDVQVRVRDEEHLKDFIKYYLVPNEIEHSKIQATPEMDYNFRIYMRMTDFAFTLGLMALDIDYQKFKPSAERKDADGALLFKNGKLYHSVLNSIWGTVCRLGRPGGVWGAMSPSNPNGYRPQPYTTAGTYTSRSSEGRRYVDTAWGEAWTDDDEFEENLVSSGRALSDSLNDPEFYGSEGLTDEELATYGMSIRDEAEIFEGVEDYVPSSVERRTDILLTVNDIPASEWPDYLTQEELDFIEPEYQRALREENRVWRLRRRSKKARRKAHRA